MEAFDRLVAEQGIDKLTVSAIAREADIDRKTFYLHYKSVSDLVNKRTEIGFEHVIGVLREQGEGKSPMERVHIVLTEANRILTHNLDVYQNVASSFSIDQGVDRFFDIAIATCKHMGIDPDELSKVDFRMRMQFYIAGALSLYAEWLKSDHSLPIERVSETIEDAMEGSTFPTMAIA